MTHRSIFKRLFSDTEINSFLIRVPLLCRYYGKKKPNLTFPSFSAVSTVRLLPVLGTVGAPNAQPQLTRPKAQPCSAMMANRALAYCSVLSKSPSDKCHVFVNHHFYISFAHKNENWTFETLCNSAWQPCNTNISIIQVRIKSQITLWIYLYLYTRDIIKTDLQSWKTIFFLSTVFLLQC